MAAFLLFWLAFLGLINKAFSLQAQSLLQNNYLPVQFMSMCLRTDARPLFEHYFAEDREGLFLLQHVHDISFRSGQFLSDASLSASLSSWTKMVFKITTMQGHAIGSQKLSIGTEHAQRRQSVVEYHDIVDSWIASIHKTPLPLKPSFAVVPIDHESFTTIMNPKFNASHVTPEGLSLYHTEDFSNKGNRFHAAFNKDVDSQSSNVPPLFPLIEALVRKQTQTHFAEGYFMLSVNGLQVTLESVDPLPRSSYVSRLILGRRLYCHIRLAPVSSSNALFEKRAFLRKFYDAIEIDVIADAFVDEYPHAIFEGELYCYDSDGSGCCPLSLQSFSSPTAPIQQLLFPWSVCVLKQTPAKLLLSALTNWSMSNLALVKSVVGVEVSSAADLPTRPIAFVSTDCVLTPIPAPSILMFISRMTFLSMIFLMLFAAGMLYLMLGNALFLLSFEQRSSLPAYVQLLRVPITLYVVYIWPQRLHEHQD